MTAFVLMWIGGLNCNFVEFTDILGSSAPMTRTFGVWMYSSWALVATNEGTMIVKTCQGYPDGIEADATWTTARAFSVISFFFALFVLVIKCCASCNTGTEAPSERLVPPMYLLLSLATGLTLLLLDSKICKDNPLLAFGDFVWPSTCSLGTGAKCIISSTVFWAAAALSGFQEQQALKEESNAVQPVSLTEPLNP